MSNSVWVVDDDESIRWVLERALVREGLEVRQFGDAESVLDAIDAGQPDVLLSDIRMPGLSGIELLDILGERFPRLPVVIMTAFGDLDSAVDAFKYGAFEYLTKPFDLEEAVALVKRAIRNHAGPEVEKTADSGLVLRELKGDSPAMQELFRIIGRLSRSTMNVLIRGESGVGKELVAQALHSNSPRADQPLVAINTAAIPAELLESELFGHEKGAFTGAQARHVGRFEQADGGTLFLDEIGDMPASLQTRLLRVLSEGRFFRVGGREEVSVDVRIIAATNRNLEKQVAAGEFREDLFHRLDVMTLNLPPLRERKDDIPRLLEHFLDQAARELGSEPKTCAPEVLSLLERHDWPGNVRELENLARRVTVMAPAKEVVVDDLPAALRESVGSAAIQADWEQHLADYVSRRLVSGETGLARKLEESFEQVLMDAALSHTRGHKKQAADLLGWGRNTLTRKMKRH